VRDGAARGVRAFERAYDEHAAAVYSAAFRVLGDATRSQDVVQDVFLGLWRAPERFDSARGTLGGYLKLVARSRALDLWRETEVASRATERLRVLAAHEGGRVDERPVLAAEVRQVNGAVRHALMRLPDSQREAIVLAYWGGLTSDQIAERLRTPLGTVKSRIRLGLIRLRSECTQALGEQPLAA
jgi:RNA polymerase sigma-70 factor (ECF subfamily)